MREGEVDLLRQHRADQRLEQRRAGRQAQAAEALDGRRQQLVATRQAVERPQVEVRTQDVPHLRFEGFPLQRRLGRATQFHGKARLADRADVRHRSQGKLAAGGEQAAVLFAVEQVDDLAGKAPETRGGQVEGVRGSRDDFKGVDLRHAGGFPVEIDQLSIRASFRCMPE